MANKNKIKELLDRLNGLQGLPTQEVGDFADKIVSEKTKGLTDQLRNDGTLQMLDGINQKLDQFKADFNLSPVDEAITEIKDNLATTKQDLAAELQSQSQDFESKLGGIRSVIEQLQNDETDDQNINAVAESVAALDNKVTALSGSYEDKRSMMESRITAVASDFDKKLSALKASIVSYDATQDKADMTVGITIAINNLRSDFVDKLSKLGGGQANRNIRFSGSAIGKYGDLNFLGASVIDNNTTKMGDVTFSGSGGSGTPGGSTTQVQYNNAGAFGGISGATSNGSVLTLTNPNLGTPSVLVATYASGTATQLTVGSVITNANLTGMVTSVGNATSFGTFTSSTLSAAISDETGTGSAVFATAPTLVSPILGNASATSYKSGLLTIAGTPSAFANPYIAPDGSTPSQFIYTDSSFGQFRIGAQATSSVIGIAFELPSGTGYQDVVSITKTSVAPSTAFDNLIDLGLLGNGWKSLWINGSATFQGTATTIKSIATISTDGFVLSNTTAAALNAQQWSPRLHFTGQGWKTTATAATQTVDFIEELQTIQGATNPSGNLVWSSQVNVAGYTGIMALTSAGNLGIGTGTGALTPSTLIYASQSNGGGSGYSTVTVKNTSSGGRAEFALGTDDGDFSGFVAIAGSATTNQARQFDIGSSVNGNMGLWTNNTQKITILANGNLSIGGNTIAATSLFNVGSTDQFQVNSSGLIPKYNNVATTGLGVPAIYGYARQTGKTAAATLSTYTVGAADGTFLVSANILVTTSTLHNFTVTVAYTDEGNTARVLTLQFSNLSGTLLTAIANAAGAVPYEGVPLHIRCKASTAITIASAAGGTYTTVTYNGEGSITQIA